MDGDGDADAGVGARELLEHEDVRDEVRSGAAELLGDADAHQAELAELREELAGEAVLAVPLGCVRRDLGLRDLAGERLDLALLVGEGEVHDGVYEQPSAQRAAGAATARSLRRDGSRHRRRASAAAAAVRGESSLQSTADAAGPRSP